MRQKSEQKFWGELRAQVHGVRSREAFGKLNLWLKQNEMWRKLPGVFDYIEVHLSSWPEDALKIWDGDVVDFELMSKFAQVQTSDVFGDAQMFEMKPEWSIIDADFIEFWLVPFVDGDALVNKVVSQATSQTIEGRTIWAWDTKKFRIEMEQIKVDMNTWQDGIHHLEGAILVTWCVVAMEAIDETTLWINWPADSPGTFSQSSGEHFESMLYDGAAVDETPQGSLMFERVCLGTHDAENMARCAGVWWPPQAQGDVFVGTHIAELHMPQLQKGESSLVRFAITWCIEEEDGVENWLAADRLLSWRPLP